MRFDKFVNMKFVESVTSFDDYVKNKQTFQLNLIERNVLIF